MLHRKTRLTNVKLLPPPLKYSIYYLILQKINYLWDFKIQNSVQIIEGSDNEDLDYQVLLYYSPMISIKIVPSAKSTIYSGSKADDLYTRNQLAFHHLLYMITEKSYNLTTLYSFYQLSSNVILFLTGI